MTVIDTFPVIDLFAGPGGLGEGFSSVFGQKKKSPFRIALSIEKDFWAHQTLSLRSFFRQFAADGLAVPQEYYQHVKSPMAFTRKQLFEQFPVNALAAENEALLFELGKSDSNFLHERIRSVLADARHWVLIGGPPCQAYSLVGRARNAGNSNYKAEKDERHFLYKEYLKIIAGHWPSVFVMENVKGILSSKAGGAQIFPRIIKDLRDPGVAVNGQNHFNYELFSFVQHGQPEDNSMFTIRSERYGIPQARHRVIILGIRSDIVESNGLPGILNASDYLPLEDYIALPALRSSLTSRNKKLDSFENWLGCLKQVLKADWFKAVPAELKSVVKKSIKKIELLGEAGFDQTSLEFRTKSDADWFYDPCLGTVLNHEARGHMVEDLHRYLYAASFAELNGRSPKLQDFPDELLPNHKSAKIKGVKNADFADRFRVQCKGRPSTTITCHISKDGHYYIHPDPYQCRSFTVREAARLQTFPDNYFFCGPRTEQFKQVGNAVPPLLARKLAQIVFDYLSRKNG